MPKVAQAAKMSVREIKNALSKDHYIVAACDSNEDFNKRIVVIIPELTEPTWVVRPNTRNLNRNTIIALALPSIDDLTLELAQKLTNMVTDFIVVREFPEFARQSGSMETGRPVSMPWNR